MNKKCTAPSCRKTFSTLNFSVYCPYCGKAYPQLLSSRKQGRIWEIRIMERPNQYVRFIKCVRTFFDLGLKEAKMACDGWQNTVFVLRRNEASRFTLALQEAGCAFTVSCAKNAKKTGIIHS